MRSRLAVPVIIVLALPAVLLTACGKDEKASGRVDPGVEMDSGTSGSKGSGSEGSNSEDSSSNDTSTRSTLFEDGSFDEASKALEGLFGEECSKAYQAFIALSAAAFGSEADAKAARSQLEDLKADLPDDLARDIDVLADAYAAIATEGMVAAGEKMSTPEFERASKNIATFFENGCQTK